MKIRWIEERQGLWGFLAVVISIIGIAFVFYQYYQPNRAEQKYSSQPPEVTQTPRLPSTPTSDNPDKAEPPAKEQQAPTSKQHNWMEWGVPWSQSQN